ncbi:MAG: nucleotidyl transferase AbiEii/AbiGii toxin family protein [Patescibacteria group bacterium]
MHPEALTKKGENLFPFLKNFSNFYLAGGTALALQIGHRVSVDFDFFSKNKISKELIKKIKKVFPEKIITPAINNEDELTIFVDKVKITFLKYPFPVIKDLKKLQGIKLLGIKEIAATKAYTIGRRGSYKDYVDLYFIIFKKHTTLDEIIKTANKKYKEEFNSRLFLEQLIYLDDIKDDKIIFLKEKVLKNQLKQFFKLKIKELKL